MPVAGAGEGAREELGRRDDEHAAVRLGLRGDLDALGVPAAEGTLDLALHGHRDVPLIEGRLRLPVGLEAELDGLAGLEPGGRRRARDDVDLGSRLLALVDAEAGGEREGQLLDAEEAAEARVEHGVLLVQAAALCGRLDDARRPDADRASALGRYRYADAPGPVEHGILPHLDAVTDEELLEPVGRERGAHLGVARLHVDGRGVKDHAFAAPHDELVDAA